MKFLSLFLLTAAAFFGAACEQHHPSELTQIAEEPEPGKNPKEGNVKTADRPVKSEPDASAPKYFQH